MGGIIKDIKMAAMEQIGNQLVKLHNAISGENKTKDEIIKDVMGRDMKNPGYAILTELFGNKSAKQKS
jgi:hypothetical protein